MGDNETLQSMKVSSHEARMGGISIILAQCLYIIYWLFHLDTAIYQWPYDVNTNDDLINLHLLLSGNNFKTRIKLSVACLWISFPFHLIGVSILARMLKYINKSNYRLSFGVYILEKSYLMWVLVLCLIIPAFEIVMISHDWDLLNINNSNDTTYYIQLTLVLMKFEIIDCIQLCDMIFMTVTLLLIAYNVYKMPSVKSVLLPKCCTHCFVPILIIVSLFVLITCLVVLFEFAESGLFAMDSPLQLVILWLPIIKIIFGLRLIWFSCKENLQLFEDALDSAPYKSVNNAVSSDTNELL